MLAEANSYLTCGSCMCPQCVSLFLLVIENYDMGVRYTPLRSTTTNPRSELLHDLSIEELALHTALRSRARDEANAPA